jgi:hypothetical protein
VFVAEENSAIAIAAAKGLWWSFVDCAAHETILIFAFGLTMTPYRTMYTTIRLWDTIAKDLVPRMAASRHRNAERRWIDLFADEDFVSTSETLYTYLYPRQVRSEVTNRKCGEFASLWHLTDLLTPNIRRDTSLQRFWLHVPPGSG